MVKSSSQNHHSRHKFSYSRKRFSCTLWSDILEPNQAEVLVRYGEDFYQGEAAITANNYGNGTVYYVGTVLN
ncbi:MAG TPA: hypothetical protein DDY31_19865 [Lachnospiraceae bacterium]|nr:hypothetical protein [Lachnospiraceae bacterium]